MKIIAISGKKQSGKDTVCSILHRLLPGTKQRVAFADELKYEVARNYHVTVPYIEQHKTTFRQLLQVHGSIQKHIHGEHYWVESYLSRLNNCIHDGLYPDYIFTPDLRFKVELSMLLDLGAVLIRVERNVGDLPDTHISEIELDNTEFPIVIQNNSSMEILESNVKKVIDKIK